MSEVYLYDCKVENMETNSYDHRVGSGFSNGTKMQAARGNIEKPDFVKFF